MKVKVKGLVFVGFAAAILSANAMAADGDAKIVTSKLYVDNTFQKSADRVTETPAANSTDWNSTEKYPSMAVLKDVKDTASSITAVAADNKYLSASTTDGTATVSVKTDNLATTKASITATTAATDTAPAAQSKLVAASAVKLYSEALDNKLTAGSTAGGTIGNNSSNDTKYPTVKNVYEYVQSSVVNGALYQPKAPTTDSTSLYLGHNTATTSNGTTTNTADWKKLEAAASANTQASTDYVTIMEDSGVYKLNIPTAQVGTAIGDIASNGTKLATGGAVYSLIKTQGSSTTSTITSSTATGTNGDKMMPTVKNVYNFVTAGKHYQPLITADSSNTNKLMLGYRSATTSNGTTTYGDSTWKELAGSSTQDLTTNANYVSIKESSGVYKVNLATDQVAADYNTTNVSSSSTKLVTGKALYNTILHEATAGTSNMAANATDNAKVPTVRNVVDYVGSIFGGGLTIPAPSGDCAYVASGDTGINPTNERACALVLVYDSSSTSTTHLKLEWVKMAQ